MSSELELIKQNKVQIYVAQEYELIYIIIIKITFKFN